MVDHKGCRVPLWRLLQQARPAASRQRTAGAGRLELRGSKGFERRVRMTPNSLAELYTRVSPFLRASPSITGHRGCNVEPRVQLLLTLYWLAHGTSQFAASDGADVAASSCSGILREVVRGIPLGLESPSFPTSLDRQQSMTDKFSTVHGCAVRGVVGVIDGTLIRVITPPRLARTA